MPDAVSRRVALSYCTAAGVPTNGTVGIDKPYTFLGPGKRMFIMSEGHFRMVSYKRNKCQDAGQARELEDGFTPNTSSSRNKQLFKSCLSDPNQSIIIMSDSRLVT
jgi:hypothetical protein